MPCDLHQGCCGEVTALTEATQVHHPETSGAAVQELRCRPIRCFWKKDLFRAGAACLLASPQPGNGDTRHSAARNLHNLQGYSRTSSQPRSLVWSWSGSSRKEECEPRTSSIVACGGFLSATVHTATKRQRRPLRSRRIFKPTVRSTLSALTQPPRDLSNWTARFRHFSRSWVLSRKSSS